MQDSQQFLYLGGADVARLAPSLRRTMAWVENALLERAAGRAGAAVATELRIGESRGIRAASGWVGEVNAMGTVVTATVAGGPLGAADGGMAGNVVLLHDADSGDLLAVLDGFWIAMLRSAACVAVAARYLACSDSSRAGIVGCGAVSRKAVGGLARVFPLRQVRVFDDRPDIAERFASDLERALGVEVNAVGHIEEAVRDLDIVVTRRSPSSRGPHALIPAGWLRPGALACALDRDSAWQLRVPSGIDSWVADDPSQLPALQAAGYFSGTTAPFQELAAIIAGEAAGRTSDEERIFCGIFGLTMVDVLIAQRVFVKAIDRGLGMRVRR